MIVVWAVNAEEVHLTCITTMLVTDTALSTMYTASFELDASIPNAPSFALNAVNPAIVFHEQIGPAVAVSKRHPYALLFQDKRRDELHG